MECVSYIEAEYMTKIAQRQEMETHKYHLKINYKFKKDAERT